MKIPWEPTIPVTTINSVNETINKLPEETVYFDEGDHQTENVLGGEDIIANEHGKLLEAVSYLW